MFKSSQCEASPPAKEEMSCIAGDDVGTFPPAALEAESSIFPLIGLLGHLPWILYHKQGNREGLLKLKQIETMRVKTHRGH